MACDGRRVADGMSGGDFTRADVNDETMRITGRYTFVQLGHVAAVPDGEGLRLQAPTVPRVAPDGSAGRNSRRGRQRHRVGLNG